MSIVNLIGGADVAVVGLLEQLGEIFRRFPTVMCTEHEAAGFDFDFEQLVTSTVSALYCNRDTPHLTPGTSYSSDGNT